MRTAAYSGAMPLNVRRADPPDAAALADLAAETFVLACPVGTAAHIIDHFIAHHLTERHFDEYLTNSDRDVLVAEEAGAFLGYSMLIAGESTDADAAALIALHPAVELSKLYVRESAHGGFVASRLLDDALAAARDRCAQTIWLGVNERNARAIRFYEKNGFATIGTRLFPLDGTVALNFVMSRRL